MGAWYTTRGVVKAALEISTTAHSDAQVDSVIESASRSVEGCTHRIFYPFSGTAEWDYPDHRQGSTYRLWFNQLGIPYVEVVSLSSLVAGGVTIPAADYFLRPRSGPPYTHLEIDRASSSALAAGDTHQSAVLGTGVFMGCPLVETPAGALAEALDSAETAVDVTNSALTDVGAILRVDSERMIVTGRTQLDTGQDVVGTIAADRAVVSVTVADGTALFVGEQVLVESERMLIVDIAANTLTVKRAVDGSTLAAHTNSSVFAPRTLTVERGALGTTAASHLTAAALVRHVVPGPVEELTIAEAVNRLLGRQSGWARTIGSGESEAEYGGKSLAQLRKDVKVSHGRKGRFT